MIETSMLHRFITEIVVAYDKKYKMMKVKNEFGFQFNKKKPVK